MNHSEQTYSSKRTFIPKLLTKQHPHPPKKKRNKLYQTKLYLSIKPEKNSNFCQSRDNDIQKFEEKYKLGQWRKRLPSDCYFILNVPIIFSEYYIYSGGSNGWRSTQVIWVFPFEITKKKNERERVYSCCRSCYRSIFLISAMIT